MTISVFSVFILNFQHLQYSANVGIQHYYYYYEGVRYYCEGT